MNEKPVEDNPQPCNTTWDRAVHGFPLLIASVCYAAAEQADWRLNPAQKKDLQRWKPVSGQSPWWITIVEYV